MRIKGIVVTLALALVAVASVRADVLGTVDLTWAGISHGVGVTGVCSSPTSPGGLGTFNTTAGGYVHNVLNQTPVPGYVTTSGGQAELFCIDLGDYTENTRRTFEVVRTSEAPQSARYALGDGTAGYPMGDTRADWLGVLADQYWTPAWLQDSNGVGIDANYAALQMAIWEIVFEGQNANNLPSSWNVRSAAGTDFYLTNNLQTGGVADIANGILTDIMTHVVGAGNAINTTTAISQVASYQQELLGGLANHDSVANAQAQDMLFIATRQVPEPSGLVLAGLGLVGLLCRRKARA